MLAQGFFTFGHVIHRENFLFLGRRLLAHVLAQQLRLTDGQPQRNDFLGGLLLLLLGFQLQDRPGVTGGQLALPDALLHLGTQPQQPQSVRHSGAGLPYPAGGFLLGQAVFVHQRLIPQRFFQGIQILTLQILDQRQLHGLLVVGLDDYRGYVAQVRHPGGTPAPLTGNDLIVAVGHFPHRQGLNDAVNGDGIRQRLQFFLVEVLPGLIGVGFYLVDRQQLVCAFFKRLFGEIPQKRTQTLA